MTLRFKWLAITLIVVLSIVVGTNSFFLFQISNELSDIELQVNSLSSEISGAGGNIANLNSSLDSTNQRIAELDEQTAGFLKSVTAVVDSVAKVMPSVVYIEIAFIDPDTGQISYASGSGVIMSQSGYILTNRHVVEGAIDTIVILQDKRVYYPTDILADDILDLAVVKIDAPDLVAATFGDPTAIKLGDTVIALGYPLSLSPEAGGATVTSGIVSNLGRSFFIEDTPYYDLIQIDAAINPGNSGGPLINLDGEVIGINSAGAGGEIQNFNYAINVATASHVFEDLVNFGQAQHPYLGLFIDDYYEQICGKQGCTFQQVGALITDIDPSGPGYIAGLQTNDIILKLGDNDVSSAADFIRSFWRYDAGNTVSLIVQREGVQNTITLTLPIRPSDSPYI